MAFRDDASVRIFFSLLRSGLYGEPVPEGELPDAIDWQAVIAMARKQAVLGVIVESVQFLPSRLQPDMAVAAKMSKFALGLIQANLIIDSACARLSSFLAGHGINGVLLKGQGVARYYREAQIRQNGDIDFYVGRRQYARAVELCSEHLSDNREAGEETEQHYGFDMDGVPIELHRIASRMYTPTRNRAFQRWTVDELEHSPRRRTLTVGATDIVLPSYDFDAVFIFYHAWRHFIMAA